MTTHTYHYTPESSEAAEAVAAWEERSPAAHADTDSRGDRCHCTVHASNEELIAIAAALAAGDTAEATRLREVSLQRRLEESGY